MQILSTASFVYGQKTVKCVKVKCFLTLPWQRTNSPHRCTNVETFRQEKVSNWQTAVVMATTRSNTRLGHVTGAWRIHAREYAYETASCFVFNLYSCFHFACAFVLQSDDKWIFISLTVCTT